MHKIVARVPGPKLAYQPIQPRRLFDSLGPMRHRERNHQGLDNQLITAPAANENGVGPVQCRARLGGTLRFYYRDAA